VLVHGDNALETLNLHLVARSHRSVDAILGVLELGDLVFEALLRRLEQAFAHLHFAATGIQFLPARLQPLKHRPLARRSNAAGLEWNGRTGDLQFWRLRRLVADLEGRVAGFFLRAG